jgi:diguanylate cyclase (GGDEF)-like protein
VTRSPVAGRVLTLVEHGKVEDALALAERTLVESRGASPTDQAALWYAIAYAELVRSSTRGVLSASERCLSLAREADSAGWVSAGMSMRAMALAREERIESALLDLARAEAELQRCEDVPLRCWAHTGLGHTYLELRLYELAQPHLEQALAIGASPLSVEEAEVRNLMRLFDLHFRWADELERVQPREGPDPAVEGHRAHSHEYAEQALARARESGEPSLVATCLAMELTSRASQAAQASLPELEDAFANRSSPDHHGGRAVVGGALARALWSLDRREEALAVAVEAADCSVTASDWQVGASAQWLVVEMEAQSGVPGATSGRAYAGLLSRVLWQQRLSTLQGAQAALQVERLHRDKELAQREASEDPLTGVANRRALDDALRSLQAGPGVNPLEPQVSADSPVSLLMLDLDDFKGINDTYGHVAGDDVLRSVAMAMRGVARTDDLVARLGGDEFVVLARGADHEAGAHLAQRLTDAISALVVGTRAGAVSLRASVGVRTATSEAELGSLLDAADAAMYEVKGRPDRTLAAD